MSAAKARLGMWWHQRRGHFQTTRLQQRFHEPLAKGRVTHCSCGREWVR